MGKTAGDYLCDRLLEWGVDTIYGFPGTGSRESSARCTAMRTGCGSSRPVTRRLPNSWPADTPSSQAP